MTDGAPPPIVRRPILVAIMLAACWASDGRGPLIDALNELRHPNDFTPDYVTAVAWARLGRWGAPLPAVLAPETADDYAQSIGARRLDNLLGPYHLHPPTALLPMLPLVPLPYPVAAAIWQALSVVLLALLTRMLAPIAVEAGLAIPAPLLFLLLLIWPPMLTNLEFGQWSPLLAVTIAAGHQAWERGAARRGATFMAIATAAKLTPLILLPYIFMRDRRAACRFLWVLLGLCLLAFPLGGLHAWLALFRESRVNVLAWQTWWHNTLSLNGLVSRLFGPGRFARPLVAAPLVGRVLLVVSQAALVGTAILATRSTLRAAPDRERHGCALALWCVLVVVLNPLGWPHYALLLLLPMALTWRAAVARTDPPARTLIVIALLLLTIPKETLCAAALPIPFAPPRSLWLSVPLFGALLIFAGAARLAFRPPARPAR